MGIKKRPEGYEPLPFKMKRKPSKPSRKKEKVTQTFYGSNVGDLIKVCHELTVSPMDMKIYTEYEQWGSDCPYIELSWIVPESEESYEKRIRSYEKRLADYKEWERANKKQIAEHLAEKDAEAEIKKEYINKIGKLQKEMADKLKKK